MANNGTTEDDLLESITRIRVRNNDLWMGILSIALHSNPEATKELILTIGRNDSAIAKKLMEIAYFGTDQEV